MRKEQERKRKTKKEKGKKDKKRRKPDFGLRGEEEKTSIR